MIEQVCKNTASFGGKMEKNIQMSKIWLDGYDLPKLKELYKNKVSIAENTDELYRPYLEYANSEYQNYKIFSKHLDSMKELLVSNYGNIKYNGLIIPSTLVKDGPNEGVDSGKTDHYREILFPGLPVKRYVFKTYRLVAEVWCHNPDPDTYTIVHHIGNDSNDNKSNLLFVTHRQHFSIHSKYGRLYKDLCSDASIEEVLEYFDQMDDIDEDLDLNKMNIS